MTLRLGGGWGNSGSQPKEEERDESKREETEIKREARDCRMRQCFGVFGTCALEIQVEVTRMKRER